MSLPRKRFDPKAFPYRSYKWERGGKVYEIIKIKKWKTKVPDMSRVAKSMVPKRINERPDFRLAERMAKETCVAESVHTSLSVLGFGCVIIWRGIGGVAVSVLYALGNIPFILIQRYNRPRHLALAEALERLEIRKTNSGGSYESAE